MSHEYLGTHEIASANIENAIFENLGEVRDTKPDGTPNDVECERLYNFHARQYDPQIGRFWGIDPLDQFPSGYTGMGNDPANNIDPSGMWVNVAWASTSWGRHVLRMGQEKIWQEYQTYLSSRIDPESILNFEIKPKNWDQPFDYAAAELEIVGYANKEWAENFREHVTDEQSKQLTEADDANGLKYINGGRMAWTPDGKILSTPDEIEAYTRNKINEYWDDDQGTIVSSGANEIKEAQGDLSCGTQIDKNEGGFFNNYNDFQDFMVCAANTATNNAGERCEVAAWELKEGNYFVQPWGDNRIDFSFNQPVPGYDSKSDYVSQWHTHPESSIKGEYGYGPSREDARNSQIWNMPVNVIQNTGAIWRVYYAPGYLIPAHPDSPWGRMPYGNIINRPK